MLKEITKKYQALNQLAEPNGVVILGGSEDAAIPLCELKQAFDLKSDLFNRSMEKLSVLFAAEVYDSCIAPLHPETLLLHIGAEDLKLFEENPQAFDDAYRNLITHIRDCDSKCRITVVSLKNYENKATITELNKHLKYIADSQRCEYIDISARKVWNPKETKDIVSFVYSTGFVRPLKQKRPVYDLVKILFCYQG